MAQQVQQRVTFRVIGIVAVVYTRSAGYNGFYTFRNVWWKTPCQGLGTRLVYFLDLVEVIESIDLSLLSIQIQSFRFYLKSWVLAEFRSVYPELGRGSLQGLEWNLVSGQNILKNTSSFLAPTSAQNEKNTFIKRDFTRQSLMFYYLLYWLRWFR